MIKLYRMIEDSVDGIPSLIFVLIDEVTKEQYTVDYTDEVLSGVISMDSDKFKELAKKINDANHDNLDNVLRDLARLLLDVPLKGKSSTEDPFTAEVRDRTKKYTQALDRVVSAMKVRDPYYSYDQAREDVAILGELVKAYSDSLELLDYVSTKCLYPLATLLEKDTSYSTDALEQVGKFYNKYNLGVEQ